MVIKLWEIIDFNSKYGKYCVKVPQNVEYQYYTNELFITILNKSITFNYEKNLYTIKKQKIKENFNKCKEYEGYEFKYYPMVLDKETGRFKHQRNLLFRFEGLNLYVDDGHKVWELYPEEILKLKNGDKLYCEYLYK